MKRKITIPLICLFLLTATGFSGRQVHPAEKINLKGFNNLYKISNDVFRSEQPDDEGMAELQKYGIRTILNLRQYHDDLEEARGTALKLTHVSINTRKISYDEVLQSLKVIQNAKKPVLVHCLHGSDRTGCVIAAYRMVFENWSRSDAIREFKDQKFGYHEQWFPNIIELLNNLDINRLKSDLGMNSK